MAHRYADEAEQAVAGALAQQPRAQFGAPPSEQQSTQQAVANADRAVQDTMDMRRPAAEAAGLAPPAAAEWGGAEPAWGEESQPAAPREAESATRHITVFNESGYIEGRYDYRLESSSYSAVEMDNMSLQDIAAGIRSGDITAYRQREGGQERAVTSESGISEAAVRFESAGRSEESIEQEHAEDRMFIIETAARYGVTLSGERAEEMRASAWAAADAAARASYGAATSAAEDDTSTDRQHIRDTFQAVVRDAAMEAAGGVIRAELQAEGLSGEALDDATREMARQGARREIEDVSGATRRYAEGRIELGQIEQYAAEAQGSRSSAEVAATNAEQARDDALAAARAGQSPQEAMERARQAQATAAGSSLTIMGTRDEALAAQQRLDAVAAEARGVVPRPMAEALTGMVRQGEAMVAGIEEEVATTQAAATRAASAAATATEMPERVRMEQQVQGVWDSLGTEAGYRERFTVTMPDGTSAFVAIDVQGNRHVVDPFTGSDLSADASTAVLGVFDTQIYWQGREEDRSLTVEQLRERNVETTARAVDIVGGMGIIDPGRLEAVNIEVSTFDLGQTTTTNDGQQRTTVVNGQYNPYTEEGVRHYQIIYDNDRFGEIARLHTGVHEATHLALDLGSEGQRGPRALREGLTETYALQALEGQGVRVPEAEQAYPAERAIIERLRGIGVTDEMLRDAYHSGDTNAILEAVGERYGSQARTQFFVALEGDNPAAALAALGPRAFGM